MPLLEKCEEGESVYNLLTVFMEETDFYYDVYNLEQLVNRMLKARMIANAKKPLLMKWGRFLKAAYENVGLREAWEDFETNHFSDEEKAIIFNLMRDYG
jgi:hypothetical protein